MAKNKIFRSYQALRKKYSHPKGQWILWCKRPKTNKEREEVVIGAILTQRANWKNAEMAIANLKKAKINSLKGVYKLGLKNKKKLALLIRPSGFYQQKAEYLFGLAKFILKEYGGLEKLKKADFSLLRNNLLGLKGIGPETADSILLYGLEKPVFVIDEYSRRLVKKNRLANNYDYHFLQKLFEENLRKNYQLYQDFHALIVIDGKKGTTSAIAFQNQNTKHSTHLSASVSFPSASKLRKAETKLWTPAGYSSRQLRKS